MVKKSTMYKNSKMGPNSQTERKSHDCPETQKPQIRPFAKKSTSVVGQKSTKSCTPKKPPPTDPTKSQLGQIFLQKKMPEKG